MEENIANKLLKKLEENRLILIGEIYEKRGRNPFLEEESWQVHAVSKDNTGRNWCKLMQVQDSRNSITICEDELFENFIKVESILLDKHDRC